MRPGQTGIILAAGRGTRLGPLTDTLPKCLIPVLANKPILSYQLSALGKINIEKIIIVVGYRAAQIREHARSFFPNLPVVFIENKRYLETNTFYSLALAAETLPKEQTVLQMNGDVVFDPKILEDLMDSGMTESYVAALMGTCQEEEIKISLAQDGSVQNLNKKIDPNKAVGEGVGINKFSSLFWKKMQNELLQNKNLYSQDYFERGIEKVIRNGGKILPFNIGRLEAVEVDFPADLQRARNLSFLRQYQ